MTRIHYIFTAFLILFGIAAAAGADPTATGYSFAKCAGSAMPYPVPTENLRAYPDSLTPVFINHIGRHGARYLSSSKYTKALLRELDRADSLRTITREGKMLRSLCRLVESKTAGRWGALDSLGMAEQRGIASRTLATFPALFDGTKVGAISSYVPRCIASMDEFTHQLARLNNKLEMYMSSGRQNNALVRPWANNAEYQTFKADGEWHKVYDTYSDQTIPAGIGARMLGKGYGLDPGADSDFAMNAYKVVSGCGAMGILTDPAQYFTKEEYNALWSVNNLEHYLTHSASTVSPVPMELGTDLLLNLVETTEEAVKGETDYSVRLRFGHAETVMPLLALMRLKGCYYMTNYFDTVGLHWHDFYVVPMASNLQLVLFRSATGKYYLRADLNETPVPLIPGRDIIYTPWPEAREYLYRCLPLYLRP